MRILVVEDNDLVADAITRGLGMARPCAVVVRSSAERAAMALESRAFRIWRCSTSGCGIDWPQLLRRLRSDGKTLPVMISRARTLATKVEALDLGGDF